MCTSSIQFQCRNFDVPYGVNAFWCIPMWGWGILPQSGSVLHYAHVLHQEVGIEVLGYAGVQGVVEVQGVTIDFGLETAVEHTSRETVGE